MQSSDPQFGLRVIKVGVGVTLTLALASLAYAMTTWSDPHRGVLVLVSVAATADAIVIAAFRHQLARSAKIELLFAVWNIAHVFVAGVAAYFDGGPLSPYMSILFVSVAFAAVSISRTYVVLIAALNVLIVLLVAAAVGDWPKDLLFMEPALVVVAVVGTAIAGDRHARLVAVQEARTEMLGRLARVIEFRDFDTGSHVERMSEYCGLIAERLGWATSDVERLRAAAPMHDIGKVAVPDSVLLKPGPLTAEERNLMERHTTVGHDMLAGSSSAEIELAAEIALTHHEHFDGGGYPQGLSGSDIPLAGRIVAVADVFDALTSDRVYRPAMTVGDAIQLIEAGRARQFDPKVVDAFEQALDDILSARSRNQVPAQVTALRIAQPRVSASGPR